MRVSQRGGYHLSGYEGTGLGPGTVGVCNQTSRDSLLLLSGGFRLPSTGSQILDDG